MRNLIRKLALIFTFISVVPAMGAPLCESVFSYRFSIDNPPEGIFYRIKSREEFDLSRPQIKMLVSELIKENRDLLKPEDADVRKHLEDFFRELDHKVDLKMYLNENREGSNYADIDVSLGNDLGLMVRTNGNFAFLGSTWLYRNKVAASNYKAVGFVDGKIQSFNQTDLILSTLPDKLTLSRVMEEAERASWLDRGEFKGMYGEKVHFGPNQFFFNDKEPYLLKFSKKDLVELHRQGLLEINIYENTYRQMLLTDLGLEFEYVFFGKKAIEFLRPFMEEQLRQNILKLGK